MSNNWIIKKKKKKMFKWLLIFKITKLEEEELKMSNIFVLIYLKYNPRIRNWMEPEMW